MPLIDLAIELLELARVLLLIPKPQCQPAEAFLINEALA